MHIGIITSGNENIRIYNLINQSPTKTTIRYDSLFRPHGDKSFDKSKERIELGIKFLQGQNVDKIIISPIFELYFHNNQKHQDLILPIFTNYLQDYVLKYSVVGKLGIAGNHCDGEMAQKLLTQFTQKYTPTESQSKTNKFHQPFKYRYKETSMRDYFLNLQSPRANMINKFMKLDCRYFKDANIDTLIPMQYSYLMFEQGLSHTFFTHNTKFHGKKAFFDVFDRLTNKSQKQNTDDMEVQIHFTDSSHILYNQKKRERLICKGKTKTLKII